MLQDIGATKVAHPTASSGGANGTSRPGSKSTLLQEVASEGKSASEGRPAPVAVAGGGPEDSVGGVHPSDPAVLAARRAAVDAAPLGCGVDVQVSTGLGHATIVLLTDCMHAPFLALFLFLVSVSFTRAKKGERPGAGAHLRQLGLPIVGKTVYWRGAWHGMACFNPSPPPSLQVPGRKRWLSGVLVSRPKPGFVRVQLSSGPEEAGPLDLPTECVRVVATPAPGGGAAGGRGGKDSALATADAGPADSTLLRRRGVCGTEVPPAAALGLLRMFTSVAVTREVIDVVCAVAEDVLAAPTKPDLWCVAVPMPHDATVYGGTPSKGRKGVAAPTAPTAPIPTLSSQSTAAASRAAASLPPAGFPRVSIPSCVGVLECFRAAGFSIVDSPASTGAGAGGSASAVQARPGDLVCLRFGGSLSTDWKKGVPQGILVELAVCVQMLRVRGSCPMFSQCRST